jgi:hypothetical protein
VRGLGVAADRALLLAWRRTLRGKPPTRQAERLKAEIG